MRLKREGHIVHSEGTTFDRRQAATAWMSKREDELSKPGALEEAKVPTVTLASAIDRYTSESTKQIGRTKTQVLRSLKACSIADMDCRAIKSSDIVTLASQFGKGRTPQTVGNYLSHLSSIFAIARPA